MSQENVETIRRSYAAYNAAASAPNTREAIRAVLERFDDPEIEWEPPPIAVDQQIYHGIDGVMEFFEVVLKASSRYVRCRSASSTAGIRYRSSSAPKRESARPKAAVCVRRRSTELAIGS